MKITRCLPGAVLPGGLVRIEIEGLVSFDEMSVWVGGAQADILGASSEFMTIRVPDGSSGEVTVRAGGRKAAGSLNLGRVIGDELHPVANPVLDSSGNVYVTFSGSRGESVPFGVFLFTPDGRKEPFLGDITNPTGLAIGPDGLIYVSSRHSGTVYRSTFDKQIEKFVDGLGIATGIVFDSTGNLLVGDRSGTVYRISPDRTVSVVCELEPSVSAYHLALDSSGSIFLTGPTLATQDCVYRILPDGAVEEYFKGLGRPQGLNFGPEDQLYVAGSYRGRKGVWRFDENRVPHLFAGAPMLVGLVFDPSGQCLYLVDGSRLFRLDLQP